MRALGRRKTFPRGTASRSRLRGPWALLAVPCVALFSGCSKPIDRAECDQMLDRYVGFLMQNQEPGVPFEEIRKKQREARVKAESSSEFAACTDRVSRKQYECAMQAPNADRLEQCLVF
ncbi:MAG: hypothetical protein KC492_30990 [Myxococcales bacterium]|nr:hypothetical protein [Myxococcales bacterium]MCB9609156.1 hypothetical protein [Polyangiaceae bacterium]